MAWERAKDLSGLKRPYYTVLRRYGTYRSGGKAVKALWLCRCGCGTEFAEEARHIISGRRKSCGCLRGLKTEEKEMRIRDFARKSNAGACGAE